MFCRFCGKTLETDVTVCPVCGQKQMQLMNGNGFWDLCASGPASTVPVNQKPTETETPYMAEELDIMEEAEPQQDPPKRGGGGLLWVLIVFCAGLVCLSVFLGIRLKQVSDERERISERESRLQAQLERLENSTTEETAASEITTSEEISGTQEEETTTTEEMVPMGPISASDNDEGISSSGNEEMEILPEEQEY